LQGFHGDVGGWGRQEISRTRRGILDDAHDRQGFGGAIRELELKQLVNACVNLGKHILFQQDFAFSRGRLPHHRIQEVDRVFLEIVERDRVERGPL
jgi:hypothetical protein